MFVLRTLETQNCSLLTINCDVENMYTKNSVVPLFRSSLRGCCLQFRFIVVLLSPNRVNAFFVGYSFVINKPVSS